MNYELAVKSLEPDAAAHAPEEWMVPWRCVSVGLMEYRRGRMPEAIANCERCLSAGNSNPARAATAQVILAMAHQQAGDSKLARMELAEVRGVIERKFAQSLEMGNGNEGYWFDWLLARILLREATGSIEGGNAN
jgi:hypothetical protein